jgi:hypothetical protein
VPWNATNSRRTGIPSDDWGVAGICDLVASADVQQEEKTKTAGLETSDPEDGRQ